VDKEAPMTLREKVIAEINALMDNVRYDCHTNRCVCADRIIALVKKETPCKK
jgi:hypothetical protein